MIGYLFRATFITKCGGAVLLACGVVLGLYDAVALELLTDKLREYESVHSGKPG